jgi:hypothetical protein
MSVCILLSLGCQYFSCDSYLSTLDTKPTTHRTKIESSGLRGKQTLAFHTAVFLNTSAAISRPRCARSHGSTFHLRCRRQQGDLLLLVGPEDAQSRILVSSKVLTVASKVFEAMLSGSFKEARKLTERYVDLLKQIGS